MNESTIVKEMDLPEDGPDYYWYADLNIVVLRAGMSCEQRLRAVDDLQRWWRRSHLSVVEIA